jgi:hypothetical protein
MDNLLGRGAAAPPGAHIYPQTRLRCLAEDLLNLHELEILGTTLSHVQVADTPRAQRVLSCSGIAALAPAMTPIADEGNTAQPTPADTPRTVPGAALWERSGTDAAAAAAADPAVLPGALGFRAVLGATAEDCTSRGGSAQGQADRVTAADGAGADVNLPPSPGGSALSGATFNTALAAGDSSSSGSSGEDTHSSAHTPAAAPPAPSHKQTASAPPGERGAAGESAAAASTQPAAAASTCPAPSHRRPVRRVLTFTDGDAAQAPFQRLEPGLLAASAPLLPDAWSDNPLVTAASPEVAPNAAEPAPSLITSAALLAAAARQSAQAANAALPAAWQVLPPYKATAMSALDWGSLCSATG